jgi:hypothetical protein
MIKGLTDSVVFRRDGKIRAGAKDEKTGYPKNFSHFLLHDAPQLIPVLGEHPTEIFFTVHSDNLAQVFQPDLRWYTKSELVCKSMHDYVDPTTQANMGSVAAFFKVGQEVAGLTQRQFPGIARSRVRQCSYKACPDYISGNCGEHMFLNVIIPQYSMGALFTLDSTSINAVINVMSAFQKAALRYQGKLAGQIFRLFKKQVPINFPNKDGSTSKRDTDVVHMEVVSFAEYEAKFRDKISPEDWEALQFIRSGTRLVAVTGTEQPLLGTQETPQALLEASQEASPTLETPLTKAAAQSDEEAIKERANSPAVAKFFAEIAHLTGKENSEEMRIATAKHFPDVQRLVDYLKGRIKEAKKAPKETPPAQPPQAADAGQQAPLF